MNAVNGGGPSDLTIEGVADLLGEWEDIWHRAAQVQETFPQELLDAIATKSTDPHEALRDHAAMLATFHPEVILFVENALHAAHALVRDLAEHEMPLPPRRRENDEVLDPKELTRRIRELETLVSGAGAVLIEARPRFDRRATSATGAAGAAPGGG